MRISVTTRILMWVPSQCKDDLSIYGILIKNTRRSWDSLTFTKEIHILVRRYLDIETGPWKFYFFVSPEKVLMKCASHVTTTTLWSEDIGNATPYCLLRINTLMPRQNWRLFADDTFKRIFMNEDVRISINISLKFVSKGLINNILASI